MKSAAEYPEYQGDPENIQFLTRNEHLAAHEGSWQNPTNWYYNPETKEFIDFGENKPIPCEAINLSEPVCSPVIDSQNEKRRIKREVHESFGDKVLRAVDAVREFSEMHPILTGIVKWGGIAAAAITTAAVANNSSGGGRSSGDGGSDYSSSESFDVAQMNRVLEYADVFYNKRFLLEKEVRINMLLMDENDEPPVIVDVTDL